MFTSARKETSTRTFDKFTVRQSVTPRTSERYTTQLLTPFQAENDYHLKDTYNYMTVQADIVIPKRHFKYLEDTVRRKQYAKAIDIAIKKLQSENKDVRALHVGCGGGLMTMHLLDKGAPRHRDRAVVVPSHVV